MRGAETYAIRRAVPADGAAIREVHIAAILGHPDSFYSAAERESWAAGLTPEGYGAAMTDGGETFEVACDDGGRVVAFCSWRGDEVCAVYVHPEAMRRGLGSVLLARAEAAIVAAGHRRIRIGASLPGRALYERRGYRKVAWKKWTTRGGLVVDTLDMVKEL